MPVAFPEPRDADEAEGMEILHAAVSDRDKWIDEQMKVRLPLRIYKLAHRGTHGGQIIAKKWLDKHGYEFLEKETLIQLAIKGKVVAEYKFNFITPEPTQ